ncbi:MAG: hypothetical protein ACTHMR_11845, partial [Thermomicrobiales bacterium]
YHKLYEYAKAEADGKAKHPGDTVDLTDAQVTILQASGHRFAPASDKQAAQTAAASTTPASQVPPPAPTT